jgi:pantetheine-phosphate adenylyltransferase
LFPLKERLDFINKTHGHELKIKVESFQGLTINFCKAVNATAIIRGLRNPADFEFEKSVAQVNRRLSGIETLFLLTAADYSYISSSIVREIINNNGDYSSLVPDAVKNSK